MPHTFGRDLKGNIHMHISATCGGLYYDGFIWTDLYYPKKVIIRMWRASVIDLLRKSYNSLTLPEQIKALCPDAKAWSKWLNQHYQKNWIVHLAKPTKDPKTPSNTWGAMSTPPLSMARLRHYDGTQVVFDYLDHVTKQYRRFKCDAEEFITRIQLDAL